MPEEKSFATAREIMRGFAEATGLTQDSPLPRALPLAMSLAPDGSLSL